MRLNYYRFPKDTPWEVRLENGCCVVWDDGSEGYPRSIAEEDREHVKYVDDTIGGITVTAAKKLLKEFGGAAWTEHIDRDGGCFEVTEIHLTGNNSRFKYNHHL